MKKNRLSGERREAERILNERIGFLHTIEFFPYHSKNWKLNIQAQKDWIYNLETTKLSLGAIRQIAEERRVKCIFGINNTWKQIIHANNDILQMEELVEAEIWKPGFAKMSFEISIYRKRGSLPILITRLGGNNINLPADARVINVIRALLNKEELPSQIDTYTIKSTYRKLL